MAHNSLRDAKKNKMDEFYTQMSDIEKELKNYKAHFKGKTVLCNCDDPRVSNFFKYFALNFEHLGLKKIITTCYKNQDVDLFSDNSSEKAVWMEYEGNPNDITNTDFSTVKVKELKGDGDFRSEECIELLKQADIVVTNPPFSLFREYVAQLIKYGKKFLIIGHQNAITYKEIFPLIRDSKLWLGFNGGDMEFTVPSYYPEMKTRFWIDKTGQKWRSMGNTCWFTNLEHNKRHENLILYKKYTPEEYPKYDNYDAINVDKTSDIPMDYCECIGVPISFLYKYNPEQFEIVRFRKGDDGKDLVYTRERESSTILPHNHQSQKERLIEIMKNYGYKSEEMDYVSGCMGVPITFLDKFSPEQFKIIGMGEDNGKGYSGEETHWDGINPHCVVNGKITYKRIFIKNKKAVIANGN